MLKTKRLILRNWNDKDIVPFFKLCTDKQVMQYFPRTKTKQECEDFIGKQTKNISENGFGFFAVEEIESQEFCGFVGIANCNLNIWFAPCIEIGWRLKANKWNKGIATEAANACLHFAFEALKIEEIFSFTSIKNKASERVMQKIGLEKLEVFDHPKIEQSNYLCKHVLYKKSAENHQPT